MFLCTKGRFPGGMGRGKNVVLLVPRFGTSLETCNTLLMIKLALSLHTQKKGKVKKDILLYMSVSGSSVPDTKGYAC